MAKRIRRRIKGTRLLRRFRKNESVEEVYEGIHWGDKVDEQIETTIDIPDKMAGVGELVAVIYRTHKGGEMADWIHEFEPDALPLLTTNAERNQLYIVGGDYTVPDEGITG